jgi:hypothetical protein
MVAEVLLRDQLAGHHRCQPTSSSLFRPMLLLHTAPLVYLGSLNIVAPRYVAMQTITSTCRGYIIASDLRVALDIMEDARESYFAWLHDRDSDGKPAVAVCPDSPAEGSTQAAAAARDKEGAAGEAWKLSDVNAEAESASGSTQSSHLSSPFAGLADGRIHIDPLPLTLNNASGTTASVICSSTTTPFIQAGQGSPVRQRAEVGSPGWPEHSGATDLDGGCSFRASFAGTAHQQETSIPTAAASHEQRCGQIGIDISQEPCDDQRFESIGSNYYQSLQTQLEQQLQPLTSHDISSVINASAQVQQASNYIYAADSVSCDPNAAGAGQGNSTLAGSPRGLHTSGSSQRSLTRLHLPKALAGLSRGSLLQAGSSIGEEGAAANAAASGPTADGSDGPATNAGAPTARRTADWAGGLEAFKSLGATPKKRQRGSIQYQPRTLASKGVFGEY